MKRFLKIIGSLAVVLVVLVIALAIAVPLLFDINDQKDRIASLVLDETGRELTIEGDLELTVFPWLGVRAGAMSLANAQGFDQERAFAAFGSADARVKLVPLLFRREVQLGRITLHGLNIHLERTADGRTNWADLLPSPEDSSAVERSGDVRADGFDLEKMEVAGLTLTGARVAYRDAQAGASYTVEELNLTTGMLQLATPVELDLDARISSGVPQWRGTVAFTGQVDYQHAARTVAMSIERAVADLEGGALPVGRLQASLQGAVNGDLSAETWRVSGLVLDSIVRGGQLPDRDFPLRLSGAVTADLSAQTVGLEDFRFDGLGLRAQVTAQGTQVVDAPSLRGSVIVEPFSPRALLTDLGIALPETSDPTALTHFEMSGQFTATKTSVALTGIQARADASQLTGSFAIADFERQALRFELALDGLDLDRYLPPASVEPQDASAGAFDAIEIPVDLIRRLDAVGSARIARLRAFGITSEDIRFGVNAGAGQLRVNPATARLYGGAYAGDMTVDIRGDTPRVAINEQLTGIQSEPFLEDVFNRSRITGTADLSAQLTGSGHTIGAIRQTLDGRVAFSFRDGAVKGFDLWHLLRDGRAVFRNEERPVAPEGAPQTQFGSLTGTGTVRRGVMNNEDFRAQLPFMNATGTGRIDFVKAEIDYRLRVTVQNTPGVDGNDGDGELRGKTVPLLISGPLADPSYRVDFTGILMDQVRERVDEARERLEQRLRDELRRIIR